MRYKKIKIPISKVSILLSQTVLRREPEWTTIDYKKIPVSKLTDSHLSNVVSFVNEGKGYDSHFSFELAKALYSEAEKRDLIVVKEIDKNNFLRNAKRRALRINN